MTATVALSEQQLDLLERMAKRELDASRSELHHTDSPEYRERVRREVALLEEIIALFERSRKGLAA